jgi:hypothetical protein
LVKVCRRLFEIFIPDTNTGCGDIAEVILRGWIINQCSQTKSVIAEDEEGDNYDDYPLDESPATGGISDHEKKI